MKTTIGDIVSSIRGQLKATRQDAFLTDRFIYSLVRKHSAVLISREDAQNKLLRFSSVIKTLDFVPLVEVDKIEANCVGLSTGITVMRTKNKLTVFLQGYYCPLISNVSSIDGSESLQETTPAQYLALSKSKNFKYNKAHYYWHINDHLYFPDITWPGVMIQGIPEDDISEYGCPDDCADCSESCLTRQEQEFNLPEKLREPIEAMVLQDLLRQLQVPGDNIHDNNSPLK